MAYNRLYIKINNVKEFITHLEPGQSVIKNNLFIIINYSGKIRRTNVVNNLITPVWDEEFLFKLGNDDYINIKIYDSDSWIGNELLAETNIKIPKNDVLNIENDILNIDIGLVEILEILGKL